MAVGAYYKVIKLMAYLKLFVLLRAETLPVFQLDVPALFLLMAVANPACQ